jgi:hypothetical protein
MAAQLSTAAARLGNGEIVRLNRRWKGEGCASMMIDDDDDEE